jgi:hypothetical protein
MIPDVEFGSEWNAEAEMYWPVAMLRWKGGTLSASRRYQFEAVRAALVQFDTLVAAGLI